MFYGCKNLTELDLSSFNTNNITNISDMFKSCENCLIKMNKSKFKNL